VSSRPPDTPHKKEFGVSRSVDFSMGIRLDFIPGSVSCCQNIPVPSSCNAPRYPWRTSQGVLVPLRDVAGLWETPQVSERWHNGSEIVS